MKNIHLLPTDKASRLFEILQFNFIFDNQNKYSEEYKKLHKYKNKSIYITSDEEIKEGDWLYHRASNKLFKYDGQGLCVEVEKIILTTDQDLIKDGVQSIDDEFLEWFIKNPSCEEVEVGYGWIRLTETDNEGYWVSIPNKQFEMQQEEPKQETLEEAAERLLSKTIVSEQGKAIWRSAFEEGNKWMQERMYSEEELKQAINLAFVFSGGMSENESYQDCELFCLKQFKKK